MPPLTAELLGLLAVVAGLLATAIAVDPRLRARRAANRLRRKVRRVKRHALQGCPICTLALESLDLDARIDVLEARIIATRDALAGGTR